MEIALIVAVIVVLLVLHRLGKLPKPGPGKYTDTYSRSYLETDMLYGNQPSVDPDPAEKPERGKPQSAELETDLLYREGGISSDAADNRDMDTDMMHGQDGNHR